MISSNITCTFKDSAALAAEPRCYPRLCQTFKELPLRTQGQPLKSGCKGTAFSPNRQTFIQEISKNNLVLTVVYNLAAENYGTHIILLYGKDATATHLQGMGDRRENGAEGGKNAHAVQKAAFRDAKGRVSHGKRPPFRMQKTAFCNTLEDNRLRISNGIRLYKVIAYD